MKLPPVDTPHTPVRTDVCPEHVINWDWVQTALMTTGVFNFFAGCNIPHLKLSWQMTPWSCSHSTVLQLTVLAWQEAPWQWPISRTGPCQKTLGNAPQESIRKRHVGSHRPENSMSTSLFIPPTCLSMNYSYLEGQAMYSDSHTLIWAFY